MTAQICTQSASAIMSLDGRAQYKTSPAIGALMATMPVRPQKSPDQVQLRQMWCDSKCHQVCMSSRLGWKTSLW